MQIAITGGSGFLGCRLARALLADPGVDSIVLADMVQAQAPGEDARLVFLRADLSQAGAAESVAEGADVIFHLAAVLSGQAEADFDLGMGVNIDATRRLLEAARAGGRRPRFVFTSSLAVFGPPLPPMVTDETAVRPLSSYGTEKAVGELLVSDYSRRGFVDGRILRLPTVCVRPGRPNAAASSFVSGIIREPLHGETAVCPADPDLELWLSIAADRRAEPVACRFLARGGARDGQDHQPPGHHGNCGGDSRLPRARGRARCRSAGHLQGGSGCAPDCLQLACPIRRDEGAGARLQPRPGLRGPHPRVSGGRSRREEYQGIVAIRFPRAFSPPTSLARTT